MLHIVAEISLYPLAGDYEDRILHYVRRLREYPEIEVTPGITSTVVRGEYDHILAILQKECKEELAAEGKCALVIKLLNTA
jgi:uncharacterized protein YqgV (UPF0045/DUF77 family)